MLNILTQSWQTKTFANSWIINTDDLQYAFNTLQQFCCTILNDTNIYSSPDLIIIKRKLLTVNKENDKFITVDQIREMLLFFNKTSIKSSNKIAIIYEAEKMNVNASNCCLKILEDTPTNSYIFLITSNISGLIPTIRSRCRLLSIKFNHNKNTTLSSNTEEYHQLLSMLNNHYPEMQLKFLQQIKSSSSQEWCNFSEACITLITKTIKYKAGVKITLNSEENKIINKAEDSIIKLLKKYDKISKIIHYTNDLDLDIRQSILLILAIIQN